MSDPVMTDLAAHERRQVIKDRREAMIDAECDRILADDEALLEAIGNYLTPSRRLPMNQMQAERVETASRAARAFRDLASQRKRLGSSESLALIVPVAVRWAAAHAVPTLEEMGG